MSDAEPVCCTLDRTCRCISSGAWTPPAVHGFCTSCQADSIGRVPHETRIRPLAALRGLNGNDVVRHPGHTARAAHSLDNRHCGNDGERTLPFFTTPRCSAQSG